MLTSELLVLPTSSVFWVKKVVPEVKWSSLTAFEGHLQKYFFVHLEPILSCFEHLGKTHLNLQTKPYVGAGANPCGDGYFVNVCSSPLMDRAGNYHRHRLGAQDYLLEFAWVPLQNSTVVTTLQLPKSVPEDYHWVVLQLLVTISGAIGLNRLRVEVELGDMNSWGFDRYVQLPLPPRPNLIDFHCTKLYGCPTLFYLGQPLFALRIDREPQPEQTQSLAKYRLKRAQKLPPEFDFALEYLGWQYSASAGALEPYQDLAYRLFKEYLQLQSKSPLSTL